MIGAVCILVLISWAVVSMYQRRYRKGYDVNRYTDDELNEGEIIYRNWFTLWVRPKILVGSKRIQLTREMIMALRESMDPRFAVTVSPFSCKLRIVDMNTMYINLR